MKVLQRIENLPKAQGIIVLVSTLLLAIGLNAYRGRSNARIQPSQHGVAPTPGSLAPDFRLTTIDGEVLSLSQFRGKTVLVNFWATWCGPCQIEMPAIQSRYEQLKDEGFVVLAVNFDESQQVVADFREAFGLTFELLLDPGAGVQQLYRNRSYPASFFIDAQGVVQVKHIGVMTEGQLDLYLERLGISS